MKIHFKVFAFACLLFVWTNVFAMSCVDYCKANGWSDFSGLGFAYKWYGVAPGMGYDTGHSPEVGSVLVWKAWSKKDANGKEIGNPAGHVAIVASIVNNGEITVNHANWSPTGVTDGLEHRDVHVKDLSGGGWTRVSVYGSGSYETYGFIYSKNKSNSGTSLIRSAPLSNGRVYWRTKNLTDLSCENAQAWLVEDNDKAMSYETDASVCPKSCYSSSAMNVGLKWLNFFIKPTYARLNDCATTVSNVPSSDSSVPESSGPKPITGGTNSGTLPNLIPNNSDVENASKTKVTKLHINEKGYCRMQTKNIGNKDAWPFQSKCWLSDGDKIDKHPKDLGKADTNKTLKPGKTNTEHEDFTAPEFPGKYNIVWCTDSAKQVKESNEGDNCHSEDPFTVWSNPNVVATSVTIIGNKTVLLPGEVYSVDTTIVNNGENFGKDIRVGWYLTGPGTGGVRVLLDTDNIKRENLKGGVSKVENLSARFAPETVGVYTLESCPDYDNRIAETNEGDNCKSMQFEVRIPPTIVYHPINAPLITSCPLPNDPDFNVMPTLPNGDVGATLFGNNKQRLFLPVATLAQAKTKLVWGGFSGFDPSLVTKICWNSEATYWGVDFSTACADGFVLQGNTWIADISNTPEASKGTWSFKQGTKDYWINPSTITDLPLDTDGHIRYNGWTPNTVSVSSDASGMLLNASFSSKVLSGFWLPVGGVLNGTVFWENDQDTYPGIQGFLECDVNGKLRANIQNVAPASTGRIIVGLTTVDRYGWQITSQWTLPVEATIVNINGDYKLPNSASPFQKREALYDKGQQKLTLTVNGDSRMTDSFFNLVDLEQVTTEAWFSAWIIPNGQFSKLIRGTVSRSSNGVWTIVFVGLPPDFGGNAYLKLSNGLESWQDISKFAFGSGIVVDMYAGNYRMPQ